MKQIFIFTLLCVVHFSFAQELQFEKGRFYLDGNKIKDSQAKELIASHEPALALFKTSKEKGAFGGLLLGAGIGLVLTDMTLGSYTYRYEYPQTVTFIGLGCIALSVPILHGRGKKMKESARLYNEQRSQLQNTGSQYELNFVNNARGFGLQLQF
jgi:hypothetical protein